MSFMRINNLSKVFSQNFKAVDNVSLNISKGEIHTILGESGCGKSTLLRIIGGFEEVSDGEIKLEDKVLINKSSFVPPEKRNIGIVFQQSALFPNMNVLENIKFGLFNFDKETQDKKANEMMNLLSISELAKRYPHEISGGQSQRVAIARALAPQPKMLLLDEPFSSLDSNLKENLRLEIASLLKKLEITALLVTHDSKDAFAIADRVSVMYKGEIIQTSSPIDLYFNPNSNITANILGKCNELTQSEAKEYFNLEIERDKVFIRPEQIITNEDGVEFSIVNSVYVGGRYENYLVKNNLRITMYSNQKIENENIKIRLNIN